MSGKRASESDSERERDRERERERESAHARERAHISSVDQLNMAPDNICVVEVKRLWSI